MSRTQSTSRSNPSQVWRKIAFRRLIWVSVIFTLFVSAAMAVPVTYTGFTIADGQLGAWRFHNARVYLTFKSDTNNAQFIQVPVDPMDPTYTVDVYINQTGEASVTIVSGDQVVSAKFDANQLFVSSDLGDTIDAPHFGGRGIGFGTFTATGIEPAYPLGVEDGTIDWGDIYFDMPDAVPSPALEDLPLDLGQNTGFSGRAWVCVGFPGDCQAPIPLHTDKGDFLLTMPYRSEYDPLVGGFFVAQVGQAADSVPTSLSPGAPSAHPITYNAYVISDVKLGQDNYYGAQVYVSMDADTATVLPFSTGRGYKNMTGKGHITIISGSKTVSADLLPQEIYAYWDIDHGSVGFGSRKGGSGYPLSITANEDNDGLVTNSLAGAVSDITRTPTDISMYSAATAGLTTNLKNETVLSGGASSCVGFNPTDSTCSTFTPVPLRTNLGDFLLFEPYRHDAVNANTTSYSVNWGLFWTTLGTPRGNPNNQGH